MKTTDNQPAERTQEAQYPNYRELAVHAHNKGATDLVLAQQMVSIESKRANKAEWQRDEAVAALREAAEWLARSTRIDDQEQAQDAFAAIARAEKGQ